MSSMKVGLLFITSFMNSTCFNFFSFFSFFNRNLVLATFLDPRFRAKHFSSVVTAAAIEWLTEVQDGRSQDEDGEVQMQKQSSGSNTSNETSTPVASEKTKTFWGEVGECLEQAGSPRRATVEDSNSKGEIDAYKNESTIPIASDPLCWWKKNKERFPVLAIHARQFLGCPPPTSVPSERLFSGAGEIYEPKRNRLSGEKADMLLFLKYNLPIFNFQYD